MSSSSRPVRRCRRRKTNLEIDLNNVPPSPSEFIGKGEEPPAAQEQQQQFLVPMIDLNDTDDDDVVETSPRTFAQAKSNARRTRRRTIVDVYSEDQTMEADNDQSRSTRACRMKPITNYDLYVNMEGGSSSANEYARQTTPEPPKVPVINCPICMSPLTEEMSTRCGHIFCKNCITTAIAAQGKCPTCRKKITARGLIRVFLPAASFAFSS